MNNIAPQENEENVNKFITYIDWSEDKSERPCPFLKMTEYLKGVDINYFVLILPTSRFASLLFHQHLSYNSLFNIGSTMIISFDPNHHIINVQSGLINVDFFDFQEMHVCQTLN